MIYYHLLHKAFYLFSQCTNGFLDVSEVHGLNIADHWYNEPLNKYLLFRCIQCYLTFSSNSVYTKI